MDVNTNSVPAYLQGQKPVEQTVGLTGKVDKQVTETSSENKALTVRQNVPSADSLQTLISNINETLDKTGSALAFTIDEQTESVVVSLKDKETDELIKQYPSEDSLRMLKNIQNYLEMVQEKGLDNIDNLTGNLLNEIV